MNLGADTVSRIGLRVVAFVRWWFALTWAIAGAVCVAWTPIGLAQADGGAFLIFIGGASLIALAWMIHPWGLKRCVRLTPGA